ncbi:IS110 family transposase [Mycoplasmatota bacterium]|nr:IS110 family transposase [Mycoplasmatota bacterium]
MAIDIAKGKSVFYIQSVHGEILLEPTEYKHTLSNFKQLDQIINERRLKEKLTVIMESTSSYHYPVERFFDEYKYSVIIINPNLVKKSDTSFRKTKTDKEDCFKIANCYFKEDIKSNALKSLNIYDNLTTLNRQYLALEKSLTAMKNRYVRLLDICIPEHESFYVTTDSNKDKHKKYTAKMLNFYYEFPHSEIIASTRVDRLANNLNSSFKRNYLNRLRSEAKSMKEHSKNSYPGVHKDSTETQNLRCTIRIVKTLQKEQGIVNDELIELAKTTRFFPNINSIPGLGELRTSQLIAELKDISRFNSYKQINAYCGLEPTIYQSGNSLVNGKISKAGNSAARKILYTSIKNITISSYNNYRNHPILLYYIKKKETKTEKESVVAATTKLIRIIFSLCKNDTLFTL